MPSATREAPRRTAGPAMPKASQSLWIASTRYPRFEPLKGDLRVDVAVVGGGITGLTAAALLAAAGKTVAVVEASRIAGGVTGYTTAHLTEVVDCSFGTLISHFGEEGARLAVEATHASLERIARFIEDRQIDCGFRRVPRLLLHRVRGR